MRKIIIALFVVGLVGGANAYPVSYNKNSHIYHKHNCEWAKKCTKNCVHIDSREAIRRGGRPCKVCGG